MSWESCNDVLQCLWEVGWPNDVMIVEYCCMFLSLYGPSKPAECDLFHC